MLSNLAITPVQALVFGLLTLPVTVWVIWTDLVAMRIRNAAVLVLLGIFVVAGLLVLPLGEYAWRYVHFVVMLAVCFALSLTIGMGAGDAKYIAAAAPFVDRADLGEVALLYAIWSVILLVGMFVARRSSALRRTRPGWIWFAGERKGHVPFGLALAPTLTSYFALGALAA